LHLIRQAPHDYEKVKAFHGFCNCVEIVPEHFLIRPEGGQQPKPKPSLELFMIAIATFTPSFDPEGRIVLPGQRMPPDDLVVRLREILKAYRNQISRVDWDNFFYRMQPPALVQHIEEKYLGA